MAGCIRFPDGGQAPALGLGTWHLGEPGPAPGRSQAGPDPRGGSADGPIGRGAVIDSRAARSQEAEAVAAALAMGYRAIDTAEMYGNGGAEEVVGQALRQSLEAGVVRRDEVFVVSKVLPGNASRRGTMSACEASLKRLGLDHLDLYLLHWAGTHPLRETIAAFEALQARGLIRRWGVSNFDLEDMQALFATPGGAACAANQVYYSLSERGIEFNLLPWAAEHGVPTMAYCPVDQGALASHPGLQALARPLGCSAAQLALAWTMRHPQVMPIPKARNLAHLRENLAAASQVLDAATLASLDALFPPPRQRQPLAMT